MTVEEAILANDMEAIIDALNAYAIKRLKLVGVKSFNGRQAIDVVGDLLEKVIEGKRDWSKAQCPFREFLFGCLKSDIDNFFTSLQHKFMDKVPDSVTNEVPLDIDEKRKQVVQLLVDEGADDDEIIVFEYWMEGINKPADIAADLNVDAKDIYVIIKRLVRRLPKIQTKAMQIV